jgi:hypothetical protein
MIAKLREIEKRHERLCSFGPINPEAELAIESCFDEIELKLDLIDSYLYTELKTIELDSFNRLQKC